MRIHITRNVGVALILAGQVACATHPEKTADPSSSTAPGALVIVPKDVDGTYTYTSRSTKRKFDSGGLAREIKISYPVTVRFARNTDRIVATVRFGLVTVEKAYDRKETVPKKFLTALSSSTTALGEAKLTLSHRGEILSLDNGPEMRRNIAAFSRQWSQALEGDHIAERDRRLIVQSWDALAAASDEELKLLVKTSLWQMFEIYGKPFPLNRSDPVGEPLDTTGKIPARVHYEVSDPSRRQVTIKIGRSAQQGPLRYQFKTKIIVDSTRGLLLSHHEQREIIDSTGLRTETIIELMR